MYERQDPANEMSNTPNQGMECSRRAVSRTASHANSPRQQAANPQASFRQAYTDYLPTRFPTSHREMPNQESAFYFAQRR